MLGFLLLSCGTTEPVVPGSPATSATTCTDVFFADTDGDAHGDPEDSRTACVKPGGFVTTSDDCDDTNAAVHPGADELCNELDDDCNGSIDDNASDGTTWYADADADGFGGSSTATSCVAPSGYLATGGDCDDASETVHPGASEICDGIDDDCDGLVDDVDPKVVGGTCAVSYASSPGLVVTGGSESPFDLLGTLMVGGDFDGNGSDDLLIGSRNKAVPELGVVVLVLGPTSGALDAADEIVLSTRIPHARFGAAIGSGDPTGDGFDAAIIGAPGASATYLFLGPLTADLAVADADVVFHGPPSSGVGKSVEILPDFDGDGGADVMVSDSHQDVVYVASAVDADADVHLRTEGAYVFETSKPHRSLWYGHTGLGDVDGDGIDDLAVGAAEGNGAVYVLPGGAPPATYDVADAAVAELLGPSYYFAAFGTTLASGDYDGDGMRDLFVRARWDFSSSGDQSGVVYGFLGPVSGATTASDAPTRWELASEGAELGWSLATGDVDGDETVDLVMGAPMYGYANGALGVGRAYVQLGPSSGVVDAASLLTFSTTESELMFGASVAVVSDWDGDGRGEVAVGVPWSGYDGAVYPGVVKVFFSDDVF